MRTFVYVDGFNLYFGALKGTPVKWLNVDVLCRLILKLNRIDRIKYFTARVQARPHDPDQPARQNTYFRALRTLGNCELHFGHFLSHAVRMQVCDRTGKSAGRMETVLKTEEKGSDVNLASHLLLDAFEDRFDQAIVVSNDSDLLTPIKFVRSKAQKKVGILNPHPKTSRVLSNEADFIRQIRFGALKASQFPMTLSDRHGEFSCPTTWR